MNELITTKQHKITNSNVYKPHIVVSNLSETMPVAIPAYSPMQIKTAYNFSPKYDGEGNTIAIIVAYGNPNIMNDVEVFNERFDLPPADIEVFYPQGQPPFVDPEWQLETSLDVEWSHALAPRAKILLVAAKDSTFENLNEAILFAINEGANIISMSWGANESAMQLEFDKIFKDKNVVFVASSGDADAVSYPASSPYVIGVGGTSMQLDECGHRVAPETGWYDSGGGISEFEVKPAYQYIPNNAQPKTDMRTSPDISFFADVFPGVPIYVTPVEPGENPSTKQRQQGNWITVGGTSVSAPCQAAVLANALPTCVCYNMPAVLYEISNSCSEHDINNDIKPYIDIKNGNTQFYPAIKGYDYVTGLGSPDVTNFIHAIKRYYEIYND
ncbi:S53 family peptidase [Clostridiaceae bacterium M8S5]|nr:S53 family peptidase [Clostridiaceae bacterium M8S5]